MRYGANNVPIPQKNVNVKPVSFVIKCNIAIIIPRLKFFPDNNLVKYMKKLFFSEIPSFEG